MRRTSSQFAYFPKFCIYSLCTRAAAPLHEIGDIGLHTSFHKHKYVKEDINTGAVRYHVDRCTMKKCMNRILTHGLFLTCTESLLF
jgi:hypothetical protein